MKELIPKCLLTNRLRQISRKYTAAKFDHIAQLRNLLENVKRDIPNIHALFPEFTPHDDLHHLEPLFKLASNLLGKNLINSLNATELFLLACALYAHDWGMAVDETYKHKLMSRTPPPPTDGHASQDWERLRLFMKEKGYGVATDSDISDISIAIWREFVRTTHTQRSADRIKSHFETIDTGIALRLSQICQSHGEPCEKLRDEELYPLRCSVLGEVVNLRAIAIYLRLADLFDLADNRTPYTIWKYVAPSDPQSIREWDKHRAIRQVTFPSYPRNLRHILVDGSTSDNELYVALEDLEAYCRKEFRLCADILAEMPDSKYCMDIADIDWKIRAEGFNPTPIRFEFDRERMLGFLGYELYQGDKLVFLRELLQNSIDAICMRRELLRKTERLTDVKDLGYIEVFVESCADGSRSIAWKDNGIGMNMNTVQRFLAVIGRSYYRSHDFQRFHLMMDPISEFGIGLLTCFTVSDTLEILTRQDQNIFCDSKPLKIVIPRIDRHFRIEEKGLVDVVSPGTTIKLMISPSKFDSNSPRIITDYLCKIAGFVEFPIVIHEAKKKTVILHPNASAEEAYIRFGSDCEIVQLRLDCTLKDMVISEDITTAKQLFKVETYNLARDLGLDDYEGILSYLVPIDNDTAFTEGPRGYEALKVLSSNHPDMKDKVVRMMQEWLGQLSPTSIKGERGTFESESVYREGILVPHTKIRTSSPARYSTIRNRVRLIVNVPKSRAKEISLARNQILTDSREWAGPIFAAHTRALAQKHRTSDMKAWQPPHSLFTLASFMIFHNLSTEELASIFPRDDWPFVFVQTNGKVVWKRYGEIVHHPINCMPDPLSRVNAHLMQNLMESKEIPQIFTFWRGPDTLIDDYATWHGSNNDSIILSALRNIIRDCIEMSHRFDTVIFLAPPWKTGPPLLQEVWVPKKDSDRLPAEVIESKLDLLSRNPSNAIEFEQPCMRESFFQAVGRKELRIRLTRFPAPFEKSFAYGSSAMNLDHPIAQALLHLMLIAFANGSQWNIPPSDLAAMRIIFGRVLDLPGAILSDYTPWANSTDDLWKIVNRVGLASHLGVRTLTPAVDQFVPGSTEHFLDIKIPDHQSKPFGDILR